MSTKSTSSSSGQRNQSESSEKGKQGGSHEQHVKAGQQSHKGTSANKRSSSADQDRGR